MATNASITISSIKAFRDMLADSVERNNRAKNERYSKAEAYFDAGLEDLAQQSKAFADSWGARERQVANLLKCFEMLFKEELEEEL